MLFYIIFFIFLSVTAIQLIYFTFILSKAAGYKAEKHAPKVTVQPASVVVCAHDALENLKILLPELYKQNHPDFEIIIVEDRSNDSTFDFLLEERKKWNNLKVVKVESTPAHVNWKKFGLTLGIKAAKHEIIVLTDADCKPVGDQWLSEITSRFDEKTNFILGVSPYEKTKGFLNAFIRFETLFTAFQYVSMALSVRPYMGVGRNLAYRRSLFLNTKGFNKHLKITGGDDDLFINQQAKKTDTKVVATPESLVYTYPKKTWGAFFIQKKRHLSVGKLYKKRDKMLLGIFSISHILFWLSFISSFIFFKDLLYNKEPYIILGGFLLRTTVFYLMFNRFVKNLNVKFHVSMLPVMDIIYIFYYIYTGISALFSKKVKWS